MFKYGIKPILLKKIRKLIIEDLGNNNLPSFFIKNMTLNEYLDICKEVVLASINPNTGKLYNPTFTGEEISYYEHSIYSKDLRTIDRDKLLFSFMDGRGLFTEHCNNNNKNIKLGNWDNIDSLSMNKWYHEDRLDDPLWFKQCVFFGIGACGHPTESFCGHIYPVNIENTDNWYILLSDVRSVDSYKLMAYFHLKNIKIPVILQDSIKYLTPKEQKSLVFTK